MSAQALYPSPVRGPFALSANSLAALLGLALIAAVSILTQFPLGTTAAQAPADLFSAQRALAVAVYVWTRRITRPVEYSLMGMVFFALASLFMAWNEPRAVIIMVWPVLLSALGWLAGMALATRQEPALRWPAVLAAALFLVHFPALILSTYFSSGLNSIVIIIAVWAMLLFALLPGIEAAAGRVVKT